MPHLIIEYAQDLSIDDQIPILLDVVHQASTETGLFVESHIKIRAIPIRFYRTCGEKNTFIHAQLRIKEGRSSAQKKILSTAVLTAIQSMGWSVDVITVEVVDMDSESYAKASYDSE